MIFVKKIPYQRKNEFSRINLHILFLNDTKQREIRNNTKNY